MFICYHFNKLEKLEKQRQMLATFFFFFFVNRATTSHNDFEKRLHNTIIRKGDKCFVRLNFAYHGHMLRITCETYNWVNVAY